MQAWFNSLEPRERKIVIGGGVILLLFCLYFLVWGPFIGSARQLKKSVIENRATLVWIKQKAEEIKTLRAQQPATATLASGQSLLGLIDSSAKKSKLGDVLKQVKPDGSDKAQVWLENASFDDVLRWLDTLQTRQGVNVVNSTFERKDEPGRVDVRLILQAGG